MKRPSLPLTVAIVLIALALAWLVRRELHEIITAKNNLPSGTEALTNNVVVATAAPASVSSTAVPLLGETILRDYANPKLPPENDLTLISHLMDNFTLLVKSATDRPLSANEDWAAAFRGLNPAHERFLSDQSVALNAQAQLVDRWGTPLFFHALGGRRFELRSAGPDKKMWTADDLHRNADGSFRRGAELSAPSLLDVATRGKSPTTGP